MIFLVNTPIPSTPSSTPDDDAAKNKEVAAVSYTLVLAPILLFGRKESPFIQFHARQGSVLFLIAIAFWWIPIIGRFLDLIVAGFAIVGFLHAAQGKRYELPFIYAILQKDIGSQRLRIEWGRIVAAWDKIFPNHSHAAPKPAASDGPPQAQTPQEPEKRYNFPHITTPQDPSV